MKTCNLKLKTYPLISFIKKDTYIYICQIFGLNPETLRNSILASKERDEYKDWEKLMKEKPKRNL